MVAQSIDPAMATIIAAIVALIGTFVANTYTTIAQGRAQIREQHRAAEQLRMALYSEMGVNVARLLHVTKEPAVGSFDVFDAQVHESLYSNLFEHVKEDTRLFFSLFDAAAIDRFNKWMFDVSLFVTNTLNDRRQFRAQLASKGEETLGDGSLLIEDTATHIREFYIKNTVSGLDIDLLKAIMGQVFVREESKGIVDDFVSLIYG